MQKVTINETQARRSRKQVDIIRDGSIMIRNVRSLSDLKITFNTNTKRLEGKVI